MSFPIQRTRLAVDLEITLTYIQSLIQSLIEQGAIKHTYIPRIPEGRTTYLVTDQGKTETGEKIRNNRLIRGCQSDASSDSVHESECKYDLSASQLCGSRHVPPN